MYSIHAIYVVTLSCASRFGLTPRNQIVRDPRGEVDKESEHSLGVPAHPVVGLGVPPRHRVVVRLRHLTKVLAALEFGKPCRHCKS